MLQETSGPRPSSLSLSLAASQEREEEEWVTSVRAISRTDYSSGGRRTGRGRREGDEVELFDSKGKSEGGGTGRAIYRVARGGGRGEEERARLEKVERTDRSTHRGRQEKLAHLDGVVGVGSAGAVEAVAVADDGGRRARGRSSRAGVVARGALVGLEEALVRTVRDLGRRLRA